MRGHRSAAGAAATVGEMAFQKNKNDCPLSGLIYPGTPRSPFVFLR